MTRLSLPVVLVTLVTSVASSAQEYQPGSLMPTSVAEPSQPRNEMARPTEALLDEIVIWLASNFDLPAIKDRPTIAFVSPTKLAAMRAEDQAFSQRRVRTSDSEEPVVPTDRRRVVALYDNIEKAIFLSDDWKVTSQADQSVLVHEMVHHLQNVGRLKFECSMAREKLAYLAQDQWLGRSGMSLEQEFEVDMFTVLISSSCMY
jgi:hypothetical protein